MIPLVCDVVEFFPSFQLCEIPCVSLRRGLYIKTTPGLIGGKSDACFTLNGSPWEPSGLLPCSCSVPLLLLWWRRISSPGSRWKKRHQNRIFPLHPSSQKLQTIGFVTGYEFQGNVQTNNSIWSIETILFYFESINWFKADYAVCVLYLSCILLYWRIFALYSINPHF